MTKERCLDLMSGLLIAALMLTACGPKPSPAATAAPASPPAQPALTEEPSPGPQPTSPPTSTATPAPSPTWLPAAAEGLSATASPVPTLAGSPTPVSDADLDAAVAELRHVDALQNLTQEQSQAKTEKMDAALTTLIAARERGAARLKRELKVLEASGEKDFIFQVLAAAGLWAASRLEEVETITDVWRALPPEQWEKYYYSTFMTALEMAETQDPRALPALTLLTADDYDLGPGPLEYPMTHEYLWGAYGPKGLPALHELLRTSKDKTAIESAVRILSRAQYLPSLPDIRAAVADEDVAVRKAAIAALGRFGHPDDYAALAAGLAAKEPDVLAATVSALGTFGDIRAVPQLVPLLKHEDAAVRDAVIAVLGNTLITPEGLKALHEYAAQTADADEKENTEYYVTRALGEGGMDWGAFAAAAPAEQERIAAAARSAEYTLMEGEKALTREEFLEMVRQWKKNGNMFTLDASQGNVEYNDVETRHILPAATADDIDLLLDARAAFYGRLSDEAIYDIRDVETLVRALGRSRYRADAIPPTPLPPAGKPASVAPVSRARAEELMKAAVNAIEGAHSAYLSSLFKDKPPSLSYEAEIKDGEQAVEVMAQLRRVVLAAAPGFVRANPPWEKLEINLWSPRWYGKVTIDRQAALDWYTGKLDDAAFEKTWIIEAPEAVPTVTPPPPTRTPGPPATPAPSSTPGPAPAPAATSVAQIDGMVMVYVPAGEFLMGSAEDDAAADKSGKPQRSVYLDAYWIDRTEVTKAQYQRCVAAGKCAEPSCEGTGKPDHPVVCVTWLDAVDYCAWAGRRLPTEAEWEKAARGTDARAYPWGNDAPDAQRCNFNKMVGTTTAVGAYPAGASPYGALDMAGNVQEWVSDWWDEKYYSSAPSRNPTGPASGERYVVRGGSWYFDQDGVRCAARNWSFAGSLSNDNFGFRCARSP